MEINDQAVNIVFSYLEKFSKEQILDFFKVMHRWYCDRCGTEKVKSESETYCPQCQHNGNK